MRRLLLGAWLVLPGCTTLLGQYEKVDELDAAPASDGSAGDTTADDTSIDSAGDTSAGDASAADTIVDDSSLPDSASVDSTPVDSGAFDAAPDTLVLDCSPEAGDTGDVGTAPPPPSCAGGGSGRATCGGGADDCCASSLITGGTFSRSYDGSATYPDATYTATISSLRLDKYEVTVGRFRKFVSALATGWTPDDGSGKHRHLNCGYGLAATGGGFEAGWDGASNTHIPSAKTKWDSSSFLLCDAAYATWTPDPGANESLPINCVNNQQALAFCIWDGGFLPSETEWNYAASGGAEHRRFPWGNSSPGADALKAIYGCYFGGGPCSGLKNIAPVGSVSAGVGRFGQLDLAGSVWEWTLDGRVTPYAEKTCVDCFFPTGVERVFRGGSFFNDVSQLAPANRSSFGGLVRNYGVGFRCARTP